MVLLDPVSYPGAIKAFAKEVCRNDLLNFGRLHFFFPDSRLSLDLNPDPTLPARPCSCHPTHPSRHYHNSSVPTYCLSLDLNTDSTLKACCAPHRRFPSRKPHLHGDDAMSL